MNELLGKVQSRKTLEKSWKVIHENGRNSKSEEVRNEIEKFHAEATSNLNSLSSKLSRGSFKFPPAKGVPIPKLDEKGKRRPGKDRPIVLANVESRIVQRAILEALIGVEALQPFFNNPNSFGGIKKAADSDIASVPAAIQQVLKARAAGGQFVMYADISKFFTKIPKPQLIKIVGDAVNDSNFMKLFVEGITTELSNMAELREPDLFPIGDIGVAQGNSLSPLMGNIILHDFDKKMNDGDCKCIRYIDDFIIIAPNRKAAIARLKLAKKILGELGMEFAEDKGNKEPIAITETFEYLGIEFSTGYVRPAPKAVKKLLDKVKQTFELSKMQFARSREGKERLTKPQSFLGAMKLVDGTVQGWSKHYWFCNDPATFRNLDDEIEKLIVDFVGAYRDERLRSREDKKRRRLLLGLEQISEPSRPHRYLPFKINGTFEPRVKPKEVAKLEPAMKATSKRGPIKPTKENMEAAIATQKAMKIKK